MSEKSEALRLADALDECKYVDVYRCKQAAAELRRLHELALEQQGKIYALEMARSMEQKTAKLKQDALRAELKEATEAINDPAVNNLRTLAESIRVLCAQRDALLEALKDAATSLETVGRLAGRSDYLGDAGERIPTYMGRHDEVREYATSRAGVARAAIKAVEEGK